MKRFQNLVLALMIGGIVAQSWVAVKTEPGTREPLDVGDVLPHVTGYSDPGTLDTVFLDSEAVLATVLYSFDPDCVHSGTVGSMWAGHFEKARANDARVRRIAVTLASAASALEFAERFGWQAGTLSVAGLSLRREYSLVSRTPWVFVFDSRGALYLHGHGSQLDEIEAAVSRLLSD